MAITPYLLYEDVGGALKFLAKAFGFRRYGAQMSGPGGKINHAAMKLGDDVIMMGCPGSGYRNPKRLGQATQSLYVNVEDVDKHFERARKAGAIIIDEPARYLLRPAPLWCRRSGRPSVVLRRGESPSEIETEKQVTTLRRPAMRQVFNLVPPADPVNCAFLC